MPKQAFAKLIHPAPPVGEEGEPLGQDTSQTIWEHLRDEGYLTDMGAVLPKFNPSTEGFELDVPSDIDRASCGDH